MRVMFICQVVGIQNFRSGLPDQILQIFLKCLVARLLDFGTWVAQKRLGGIFPNSCGFFLLFHADLCHLVIAHVSKFAGARRTVPVGDDAAGEMELRVFKSEQNAFNSHDFNVILVCCNAKMCCS